jgi:hypothetical protein
MNHYIVSALQFEHVYTYILLDQVPASTSVCMSADMTSEYILGVPMDTYIHTNIHTHTYTHTPWPRILKSMRFESVDIE